MRRSKFSLGAKPSAAAPALPRKRLPRYDAPRVQPKPASEAPESRCSAAAGAEEDEAETDLRPVDAERAALPRAQLELDYRAALQERELLLNQLAGLLEDLMATAPPAE
jgi:hypothetical protein